MNAKRIINFTLTILTTTSGLMYGMTGGGARSSGSGTATQGSSSTSTQGSSSMQGVSSTQSLSGIRRAGATQPASMQQNPNATQQNFAQSATSTHQGYGSHGMQNSTQHQNQGQHQNHGFIQNSGFQRSLKTGYNDAIGSYVKDNNINFNGGGQFTTSNMSLTNPRAVNDQAWQADMLQNGTTIGSVTISGGTRSGELGRVTDLQFNRGTNTANQSNNATATTNNGTNQNMGTPTNNNTTTQPTPTRGVTAPTAQAPYNYQQNQ